METKITILVCDDDPTDILILKKHLGKAASDYNILEASSEEDIQYHITAEQSRIQLIFMDYYLRASTGLDWLKEITKTNFAPVIMLTGKGGEGIAVDLMKAGAFDYIPKERLLDHDVNKVILDTIQRWKTERERDHLLGIAAHEFRGPLAVIMGCSETMMSYPDLSESERQSFIAMIHDRSQHLSTLISQILDFGRIERGTISLNIKRRNIIGFLKKCIEQQQRIAQRKNIAIVFNTDMEDLQVEFDSNRLEEVIANIIDNAVKYSPRDTKVSVTLENAPEFVTVEISDEGQGIKEEELQFLFEMFSNKKISSRPTEGESSHGFGLAICKKIVDMHGGKIEVRRKQGKGSVFIVSLPRMIHS